MIQIAIKYNDSIYLHKLYIFGMCDLYLIQTPQVLVMMSWQLTAVMIATVPPVPGQFGSEPAASLSTRGRDGVNDACGTPLN